MRRGVSGESFPIQLVTESGKAYMGVAPEVWVYPVGSISYRSEGKVVHVRSGGWVFYPELKDYDYIDVVGYQFIATGMMPVMYHEKITQEFYEPPTWIGGDSITKDDLIDLISPERWGEETDRFLQLLLSGNNPVLLTPERLLRLQQDFPNQFKR